MALPIAFLAVTVSLALAFATYALSAVREQRIRDRDSLIDDAAAPPAPEDPARRREAKAPARLREAGLDMSQAAWAALQASLALASFAAALAIASSAAVAAAAAASAIALARAYVGHRAKTRRALFEAQFGRACAQIASSVRTGLSVERAIRSTAAFVDDPLREELARVAAETRHDPDTAAALYRMAERTKNRDVAHLASAVDLNQRRGGKLADMIERLSSTVATRQEMKALIRSESASGRNGAKAVVGITAFLVAFQCLGNPANLEFYLTDPVGWAVGSASLALLGIGCARLYRLVNIKVD